MKRRRRIWPFLVIALASTPVIAWFAMRPKMPVEFVGERPPVHFVFLNELNGKPFINLKLPWGGAITYPKPRHVSAQLVNLDSVAGFLEFPDAGAFEWTRYRSEGTDIEAGFCYVDDPSRAPAKTPRGVIVASSVFGLGSPPWKRLVGVPYATAPEYQEVELVKSKSFPPSKSDKVWKVKLPVTDKFGPAIRKPTIIPAARWTITAKPRPWKYSTSAIVYDFTVDAPAGRTFLLDMAWDPLPKKAGVYSFVSNINGPTIVTSGKKTTLSLGRFGCSDKLHGKVFELEPVPLMLTAKRDKKKKTLQLFLPSGDCIYGKGAKKLIEDYGYKSIECRGRWLTISRPATPPRDTKYTFERIQDGEKVQATGYRVKARQDYACTFDLPTPVREGQYHYLVYSSSSSSAAGTASSTIIIGP